MQEVVFLNGRFLPIREAKVPILDPGFLLGYGVFETMRSYNNRIVYIEQHLKRIEESCKLIKIGLSYSFSKLKGAIEKTIKVNSFKDAYVRLTIWKAKQGKGTLIIARRYQPYSFQKYRNGFSAKISKFMQNEHSFPVQIKTTSRVLHELSYLEAKNKGFDEAIILNNRGYVTEGSRSNIFLVKQNTIFTPSLTCGCLNGITRRVVFELVKKYHLKIYEGNFTPQDFSEADEAFLTNSLMGVMPLGVIEKYQIAKGVKNFKLTQFFMRKYNDLLKNEN